MNTTAHNPAATPADSWSIGLRAIGLRFVLPPDCRIMVQQSTRASTLHWLMFASGTTTFLLMLGVSLVPVNALALLAVVVSLLGAQLSAIVLVLFSAGTSLAQRLWCCGVYGCGLYFALLFPPALAADRYGYAALPAAHIGLGILAAYAVVLGAAQRSNGIQLSMGTLSEAPLPDPARPPQFRLIDLMKWVTLICVALGLWSTVMAQFLSARPLVSWSGVYYAYGLPSENSVGGVTFLAGGPVMLLQLGTFWMTLSESVQRKRWIVGLAVLWLAVLTYVALLVEDYTLPLVIFLGPPLFLLPALLHALVMRRFGWRMTSTSSGS